MIRLFASTETNFNHNKWVLSEAISCYITEAVEGIFDMDLVYPLEDDRKLSQNLVIGNIIKSPISETDSRGEQLFKIRKRSSNTKEKTITIYAQANARRDLDLNMVLGLEVPAGTTRKVACQMILSKCVDSHKYYIGNLDTNPNTSINLGLEEETGNVINYLDISGISARKAFLDDQENSIFKAYGGEIIFNNYEINMVDERGSDHSFEIMSGKNLEELQQDIDDTDTENFVTAVLPCSSDGVYLPNSEIIYSPNVAVFGKRFKKVVFDDVSLVDNTQEAFNVVYAQLRERVQKLFDDGLDKIKINNTINFVQLANTEEYKEYKVLEKCELGNNVTVKYFRRDDESQKPYVEAVGRVTKIKFNVLTSKIEEVEIGERKKKSIVDDINSTTNKLIAINDKANSNKAKIKKTAKEAKEYTDQKANDLTVIMQKSDSDILLEVRNNKTDVDTKIQLMDGEIDERVTKGDFGSFKTQTLDKISQCVTKEGFSSELTENATSITGIIHDQTDHSVTLDSDGLSVKNGAFTIYDSSGKVLLRFNTNGNAGFKSLDIEDVGKGSAFYNTLVNMEEVSLNSLKVSHAVIPQDTYVNGRWGGGTLEEYIKHVAGN